MKITLCASDKISKIRNFKDDIWWTKRFSMFHFRIFLLDNSVNGECRGTFILATNWINVNNFEIFRTFPPRGSTMKWNKRIIKLLYNYLGFVCSKNSFLSDLGLFCIKCSHWNSNFDFFPFDKIIKLSTRRILSSLDIYFILLDFLWKHPKNIIICVGKYLREFPSRIFHFSREFFNFCSTMKWNQLCARIKFAWMNTKFGIFGLFFIFLYFCCFWCLNKSWKGKELCINFELSRKYFRVGRWIFMNIGQAKDNWQHIV